MSNIDILKRAARIWDPALAVRAVKALRQAGHTYRDCYRIALAGEPSLTWVQWGDLMADAPEVQ